MTTGSATLGAARAVGDERAARLDWRDDLVTVLLGLWLLAGLFVDGWAHFNLAQLETFFTPWHAIFYSGYGASAVWLCWLIRRGRRAGRVGLAAIPRGYELGLVGVVLFGAGGVGDLLWHLAFGVERDRAALLSPTHLTLFAGMTLIVTSPLRSAWASDDPAGDAPSLVAFLPPLLSLTAATALVVFLNEYLWAFAEVLHTPAARARVASGGRLAARLAQDFNLATILITNLAAAGARAAAAAALAAALRQRRAPLDRRRRPGRAGGGRAVTFIGLTQLTATWQHFVVQVPMPLQNAGP